MDIANAAQAGDATIERDGLKVYLEQKAGAMLTGATIDYTDSRGFSISGGAPAGGSCDPRSGGSCKPSGGSSCCG